MKNDVSCIGAAAAFNNQPYENNKNGTGLCCLTLHGGEECEPLLQNFVVVVVAVLLSTLLFLFLALVTDTSNRIFIIYFPLIVISLARPRKQFCIYCCSKLIVILYLISFKGVFHFKFQLENIFLSILSCCCFLFVDGHENQYFLFIFTCSSVSCEIFINKFSAVA